MSKGIYDDGDYSRITPVGPGLQSFDPEKRTNLFSQQFESLTYIPAVIGSIGPANSYLLEESAPMHAGCGVKRWTRTYAQIPPIRTVPQSDTQTYQFLVDGKVVTFTVGVTAYIKSEWFHTNDPTKIQLEKAFAMVDVDGQVYFRGKLPLYTPGGLMLGADQTLDNWKGNMYVRKSKIVAADPFIPNA